MYCVEERVGRNSNGISKIFVVWQRNFVAFETVSVVLGPFCEKRKREKEDDSKM